MTDRVSSARTHYLVLLAMAIGVPLLAACATTRETTPPPVVTGAAEPATTPESGSTDGRLGLSAGWMNAEEATWNMRLVSETQPSPQFIPSAPGDFNFMNSDMAFTGNYLVQGNFNGIQIWDISNPAAPSLVKALVCPGWQNDVSIYEDLLFVSVESLNARLDCGTNAPQEEVSADRIRGIRIFDISDIANPRLITNVQTCRGSHTHTLVTDANDPENVYIYVSGSAPVRPETELPGCVAVPPDQDPNSALLRIDVIQVPVAAPEQARVVSSARIFEGLETPPTHPEPGQPSDGTPLGPSPDQCHDITVYPDLGLAGGACQGHGFLLDIRDPANPKRVAAVTDANFAYWHSATFNNDGTKILFTDEWGGGLAPKCRATDRPEWGADAIFSLTGTTMTFESYYKLPVAQTEFENCVAHNGSLVPVPGRDIMAQSWYQGGVSVFDWTDPKNPVEIAYFDRGPMSATELQGAGSWSVYWYNGRLYSSEIARGLDVLELTPSEHLSQNEIDAAKLVRFDVLNVQEQPKLEWPPSFVVARAYLDQLERNGGLAANRIAGVRSELDRAEGLRGQARIDALTALAGQIDADAAGAADGDKVRTLAQEVRDLANAQT
jgi:hypothetical protein